MPYISFKIKIIDFNCRFSKIFTNNTRKIDLAFPCYYRIYVSLQGRFLRPKSEDKTPTCSEMSIARLQSYSSRSKIRSFGFLEILPQTDHRHRLFLQIKPFWKLDVHISTNSCYLCTDGQNLVMLLQYVC